MVTKVIKRNKEVVEFDKNKIKEAIAKAFIQVDGELTEQSRIKCNEIANYIYNLDDYIDVETIQNIVENKLMASNRKDVAVAYIRYRYKKEVARNTQSDFIDAIRKKLNASDVQNQNANVDEHSFGGRIGEASGVVTKKLALDYIVSPMARNNHENNEIYIHDLDAYYVGSHNCLSIPFDDLLANGFNTRQTDVRPAGSVSTAFQLVAVIFQLQSLQQFGGVSATHLDWTMIPYVRKSFNKHFCDGLKYIENAESQIESYRHPTDTDITKISIEDDWYKEYPKAYKYAMDMTIKEVHQAAEGLYHNLNTLQSRSGNQLK